MYIKNNFTWRDTFMYKIQNGPLVVYTFKKLGLGNNYYLQGSNCSFYSLSRFEILKSNYLNYLNFVLNKTFSQKTKGGIIQ